MPSYATAHGGGHGGHSGGGHASSHSGGTHSSGVTHSNGSSNHASGINNTRHTSTRSVITRSTSPSVITAHHARSVRPMVVKGTTKAPVAGATAGHGSGTTENNNSVYPGFYNNTSNNRSSYNDPYYYSYYYPYYSYYYAPFFYDPYYSPFMLCFGFMYSPSYYPGNSPAYANNQNNEQLNHEPMDGFVVFYNDTLSGAVTVAKRSISLETTDSGRNYDYKFHQKDQGVQYVTVYNEDDKQLSLVRLKDEPKKLWRVIHTGKLNIYDDRRGFIYKPGDIDVKSLTVSYNGETASLHSNSVNDTKEWLTEYVNRAYGSSLDPKKFNWNELLIYIDKLD